MAEERRNRFLLTRGEQSALESANLLDYEVFYSRDGKRIGIKDGNGIEWFANVSDLFSGDYSDLSNKPTIPTKISELTNDKDYVDENFVNQNITALQNNKADKTELFSGSYNDLTNKPTIPTKTSQLTNDSGFATETYVNNKVASVYKYKGSVATFANLPTTNRNVGDVYDVKDTGMNYAWNGTEWDALGTTVDLSNYATKTELTSGLSGKVDKVDGKQLSTNDFTTAEKTKLSGIAANAQVNVLEGVKLNGTDVDISSKKSNIVVNKTTVGLGNVKDVDTTNPANITQSATYRFVSDTEKSIWNGKQNALVSGTNIKTINGQTILGSGNITIEGGSGGSGSGSATHDIVLIPDTEFTITQAHLGKTLIVTSSKTATITVPTQVAENIEKGFFCDIVRYGAGRVYFSDSGIVLNSAGPLSIDVTYAAVSLIKIDDNNEWLLIGGKESWQELEQEY